MTKFLLVFGTLKYNCPSGRNYNYERFGKGTQKFIKEVDLPGFTMYSLGPYPAICESENDKIKAELHEVDSDAAEFINEMEIGAGYKPKEIKLENGRAATIYVWPREKLVGKYHKIDSGNWD